MRIILVLVAVLQWANFALAAGARGANTRNVENKSSDRTYVDGYIMGAGSYITPKPDHWGTQKLNFLAYTSGKKSYAFKWKLGLRGDYNFVYDTTNFFDDRIADPQKYRLDFDETYLDMRFWGLDFRLGRQNIIWGELVGQYVADVVSARDMREFILPDIDQVRIPQWALLVEKYSGDFHFEMLGVPVTTYDVWAEPGDDFFPFSTEILPGVPSHYDEGSTPSVDSSRFGYGARAGYLFDGWDTSLFYFSSMYREPVVERRFTGTMFELTRDFYRLDQSGMTVSKDFDSLLFKFEFVYQEDVREYTIDDDDLDGTVYKDALKGAISLEPSWLDNGQTILQVSDRFIVKHERDLVQPQDNPYVTLYVNQKFFDNEIELELITMYGIFYKDVLVRPKIVYNWTQNLKSTLGYDMFDGPEKSQFGYYREKDRVYTNLKYFF